MNKILFLVTFCLITASVAATQTPALTEEMKKLEFLVGEWKGEGRQLRPDGSPENSFEQELKVKIKDGSVLRISETRNYKMIIAGKDTMFVPGTPVFRSSSLEARIYYDSHTKLYQWAGETSYGRKNAIEAKLIGDRTLQYGIPFSVPFQPTERHRRTTIQITDAGEWNETLEIWHLGRWFLVEESILKKKIK
jgi:hypothetical protein